MVLWAFLIILANNLVALIAWIAGWDLFPFLAVALYLFAFFTLRRLPAARRHARWNVGAFFLASGAGILLGLPAILFFFAPLFVGRVSYAPITQLSAAALALRLLVQIPLLTALVEEVTFREVLLIPGGSTMRTIGLNVAIFTAWHLVATGQSIAATPYRQDSGHFVVAYFGSLLAVAVGGFVYIGIRLRTGHWLYAALTHWLSIALVTLAIWSFA